MGSPGVTIKIDDKDLRDVFASLADLKRASTTVGYHEATPVPDSKLTLPMLAAIQEYGTAKIPARPFMRNGAKAAEPLIEYLSAKVFGAVVMGESSPTRALADIGNATAGRLLEQLETSKSWAAPNAPYTIKKKGYDFPLYAGHGSLRDGLQYAVLDKGKRLLLEKPSP